VPDVICLYMLRAVLARDPQSVIFYDSRGQFVGVRRPGSGKPIQVILASGLASWPAGRRWLPRCMQGVPECCGGAT
jgi:hypothetical protein